MSENKLNKIPWVFLFVIGVQLHFLAVIFPYIRDFGIHFIGIGIAIVSASAILILYNMKRGHSDKFTKLKNLQHGS